MGAWCVWMLTFIDLDGGGEVLGLPMGQGTLTALRTREGGGGGEGEGKGRQGGGGNF